MSDSAGTPQPTASIAVGDYVKFARIIEAPRRAKIKDASGKNHGGLIGVERVAERSGSGQVLRISLSSKHVDGAKYRTARVDAGPVLGTVTAVLDDAVIIGVQLAVQTKLEEFSGAISMYDTQGGGA